MPKKNASPNYLTFEQDMNIYLKEDDDFPSERVVSEITKDEIIKDRKIVSRVASQRGADEEIEPIKRETPRIVGSLFDRMKFLKERINEANSAMSLRKSIHETMMKEIDEDISDKKEMEGRLVDIDDKRNLRMDMSLLRKEARAETVRFWKDLLELRTELSELLEQYQTESKIVGIFNGLGDLGEEGKL